MTSVTPGFHPVRAAAHRQKLLSGNAMAVGSMLFWAAGFPAAEILLDSWHPISLMVLRLTMALSVLVPLWIYVDGLHKVMNARWGKGIWIGMLGFGTGANLLLFAQWFTDPVTVALIVTTTPISATLIEVLGRQRRLTRRFVVGLAASVLGGAIAVGGRVSPDLGWGLLMAIASGICFAWASNAAVRDFPSLSPVGRSTITFCGAAVFTGLVFTVMWAVGMAEMPRQITSQQIGLLAIYAVAAMALSQILFIASVGRLGIALSSFHINIAPFYVMVILIALGGAWDWRAGLGAAVVGLGVPISQHRSGG
ncbi:MAG: DMT family transporter [Pseudomonadota bacterium]